MKLNELERQKTDFLIVGEAREALNWSTTGLMERTFDYSRRGFNFCISDREAVNLRSEQIGSFQSGQMF